MILSVSRVCGPNTSDKRPCTVRRIVTICHSGPAHGVAKPEKAVQVGLAKDMRHVGVIAHDLDRG